jgi:transcriptional/translational regulatory protein YebC/TACO1
MAEPGAVGWQFSRRGVVTVDGRLAEDDVMAAAIEAGADDVARDGDVWRVTSEPSTVFDVKASLEAAGVSVLSAESTMVSSNLVPVEDLEDARKVLCIMNALEDNDDVQDVYSNFDMSDDTMTAASA